MIFLRSFRNLLLIPSVREFVGRFRLWYFLRVQKRWQAVNSKHAFDLTVQHNLKQLRDFSNPRMDLLIRPLSVLEFLNEKSSILIIGPRNENDLLRLMASGFSRSGIRGLDLISYSPWIDVGDMHETPYGDNTWDAILCGWTISYSRNPERFAREMLRIAKLGCVLVIAVEFVCLSYEDAIELEGYSIEDKGFQRINSVDQILRLFDGHVDHVYFSYDAPLKRHHTAKGLVPNPSGVGVIFTVRK